jgi:protease-4
MGNIAASGGYYVSAPAKHIMSQPTTITGSIGVIMGRISAGGLYEKARVNRVSLKRGERADLFSDLAPLTEDERAILFEQIQTTYGRFKEVVANGRDLPQDELDPICEGRVWSGRQALERSLVDSHGDFEDALRKAAELAEISLKADERVGTINFHGRSDDTGLLGALLSAEAPGLATAVNLLNLLDKENLVLLHQKPLYLLPFSLK